MARILIVDHERHILRLMAVNFERAGHTVLAASNGEAALDLARKALPELIVLDTTMPGVSGYEVLHQLEADPELRSTPVVLLSWMCAEVKYWADEMKQVRATGRPFLVKPFNPVELIALAAKMLKGRPQPPTTH